MENVSTESCTHYIPKDPTQRHLFLSKYPKFDGRGCKIAIIDGGIDLNLSGLKRTSEGLPKIIDCFDFTEAGNVDTSFETEMDSTFRLQNILIGMSGRKLKIPKKWKNPSGKWHLGLKALYKHTPVFKPDAAIEKFPELDCIVWFDGDKWQACIDTFEAKNLENAKILTNYQDQHDYGILSINQTNITYCITVHNEGNLLEIYTNYCEHGSGVTQVAAAHFPDDSEKDGLAPGAQIISMIVLDPQLKNTMNRSAVKKALNKCIEMNVDIINYSVDSFGGDSAIHNLIYETVKKHNILIFKGLGNRGPLLFTVNGYDSHVQDLIFTVGALSTPEMRKVIYNLHLVKDDSRCIVPSFSSRGPCASEDGSIGVDFVAPGAAVFEIQKVDNIIERQIFDGTSYSAPNAAGTVACLLSGLKANKIKYCPSIIRNVLFKTAILPTNGSKFEFGHGIIQIDEAYNYFYNNKIDKITRFLWSSTTQMEKILYIQKDKSRTETNFFVDLPHPPPLRNNKPFQWILKLSPKAKKFIQLSKIDENYSVSVKINTTKLEPGSCNYAEIHVMHPFKPSSGSIFDIPVTVIVPFIVSDTDNNNFQKQITLTPGNPCHIFIYTLFKRTKKCEIKMIAKEKLTERISLQYANNDEKNIELIKPAKIFEFSPEKQIQNCLLEFQPGKVYEICVNKKLCFQSDTNYLLDFNFEKPDIEINTK